MKTTLLLASCLIALAACDMSTSQQAATDCRNLKYKPGTAEYEHCKVDMKQAEKMDSQNRANMQ